MLRIASCQTNRLFILLERAEKEIRFSLANGMFKPKMDIDRHGPRLMPNNCKNLNPPNFSLPSTFNPILQNWFGDVVYMGWFLNHTVFITLISPSVSLYSSRILPAKLHKSCSAQHERIFHRTPAGYTADRKTRRKVNMGGCVLLSVVSDLPPSPPLPPPCAPFHLPALYKNQREEI